MSSALKALIDVKPFKEELIIENTGDLVTPSNLFTDLDVFKQNLLNMQDIMPTKIVGITTYGLTKTMITRTQMIDANTITGYLTAKCSE